MLTTMNDTPKIKSKNIFCPDHFIDALDRARSKGEIYDKGYEDIKKRKRKGMRDYYERNKARIRARQNELKKEKKCSSSETIRNNA